MNPSHLSLAVAAALMCPCFGAETAWAWMRTETSLALQHQGKVVWRLNADPKMPKSHFHPLATVDGEVLTAFEPADHPWHRGLWWSWKYINGINYWEENPKTGTSDGITSLTHSELKAGDDFKARAELHFSYHPPGKPPVMTEVRRLEISKPDEDGTYTIDWVSTFTVGAETIKLDRTLPPSRGGPAFGGYAGLSLRFPKDLEGWAFRSSEGIQNAEQGHGKPARWVDFSGPKAGIAIFDHPGNVRHPQSWYLSDKPSLLFFNPTILFDEPMELAAGETLTLRYRILVHSKPIEAAKIYASWREFALPTQP